MIRFALLSLLACVAAAASASSRPSTRPALKLSMTVDEADAALGCRGRPVGQNQQGTVFEWPATPSRPVAVQATVQEGTIVGLGGV